MFLGRVMGHITSTAKDPSMIGAKLLIVEPLKVDYDALAKGSAVDQTLSATGRAIVANDTLGAGRGQLVLIAQGSSARMAEGCNKLPTDAVIVGIVDDVVIPSE